MYLTTTTAEDPWMPGDLRPYGDVPMSPAAGVLNYGQGLFEGMKAYRTSKGRIVFFRPEKTLDECNGALTDSECRPFPNPSSWTPWSRCRSQQALGAAHGQRRHVRSTAPDGKRSGAGCLTGALTPS